MLSTGGGGGQPPRRNGLPGKKDDDKDSECKKEIESILAKEELAKNRRTKPGGVHPGDIDDSNDSDNDDEPSGARPAKLTYTRGLITTGLTKEQIDGHKHKLSSNVSKGVAKLKEDDRFEGLDESQKNALIERVRTQKTSYYNQKYNLGAQASQNPNTSTAQTTAPTRGVPRRLQASQTRGISPPPRRQARGGRTPLPTTARSTTPTPQSTTTTSSPAPAATPLTSNASTQTHGSSTRARATPPTTNASTQNHGSRTSGGEAAAEELLEGSAEDEEMKDN